MFDPPSNTGQEPPPGDILEALDSAHVEHGRLERRRLRAILEVDRRDLWNGNGHRSLAEFLAARYGISQWKARRMIGAAYSLEHLPVISHALEAGILSLDKVVELTRFATPATERDLVKWASRVTPAGIRHRADVETRKSSESTKEIAADRHLSYEWAADDSCVLLDGRLPAAEGRTVIAAIDDLAKELPADPTNEADLALGDDYTIDQRRADALVLLAQGGTGPTRDPLVVVHASERCLLDGSENATVRTPTSGVATVVAPETARRLCCEGRIEVVLRDSNQGVIGVGRATRDTPAWLRRRVFERDEHTCTFPGCEMKRFLHPHHVEWWSGGGPTDLDNLITVCTTHHKLVHEERWSVTLGSDGVPTWFRPSGRVFEPEPEVQAGPPPPSTEPPDPFPWPALWHAVEDGNLVLTEDAEWDQLLAKGARENPDRLRRFAERWRDELSQKTRYSTSPTSAGLSASLISTSTPSL